MAELIGKLESLAIKMECIGRIRGIHPPIKKLLIHYAEALKAEAMSEILLKESIDNEEEAKTILGILDEMCVRVAEDAKAGVVVLNQVIQTADAEKVCSAMEDYLEDLGYGALFEDD